MRTLENLEEGLPRSLDENASPIRIVCGSVPPTWAQGTRPEAFVFRSGIVKMKLESTQLGSQVATLPDGRGVWLISMLYGKVRVAIGSYPCVDDNW